MNNDIILNNFHKSSLYYWPKEKKLLAHVKNGIYNSVEWDSKIWLHCRKLQDIPLIQANEVQFIRKQAFSPVKNLRTLETFLLHPRTFCIALFV